MPEKYSLFLDDEQQLCAADGIKYQEANFDNEEQFQGAEDMKCKESIEHRLFLIMMNN